MYVCVCVCKCVCVCVCAHVCVYGLEERGRCLPQRNDGGGKRGVAREEGEGIVLSDTKKT